MKVTIIYLRSENRVNEIFENVISVEYDMPFISIYTENEYIHYRHIEGIQKIISE